MRKGQTPSYWTAGERNYLRAHADECVKEVHRGFCQEFPNKRTYSGVLNQMLFLGLRTSERGLYRPWKDWEVVYMQMHPKKSAADLASDLGRPLSSVYGKLRKDNIRSYQRRERWQPWEELYLRTRPREESIASLAAHLGKSYRAVNAKLSRMHLPRAVKVKVAKTVKVKVAKIVKVKVAKIVKVKVAKTVNTVRALRAPILDQAPEKFPTQLSNWFRDPLALISMEDDCVRRCILYCIVKRQDGKYAIFRGTVDSNNNR